MTPPPARLRKNGHSLECCCDTCLEKHRPLRECVRCGRMARNFKPDGSLVLKNEETGEKREVPCVDSPVHWTEKVLEWMTCSACGLRSTQKRPMRYDALLGRNVYVWPTCDKAWGGRHMWQRSNGPKFLD